LRTNDPSSFYIFYVIFFFFTFKKKEKIKFCFSFLRAMA